MKNKMTIWHFFFTPAVRIASCTMGLFAGLAVLLVTADIQMGLLYACLVILGGALVLPFVNFFRDLPYVNYFNNLSETDGLLVARVKLGVHDGSFVGGILFLSERKIRLFSAEQGKHELIVEKANVREIRLTKQNYLFITMTDKTLLKVVSIDIFHIFDTMDEHGWNCVDDGEDDNNADV